MGFLILQLRYRCVCADLVIVPGAIIGELYCTIGEVASFQLQFEPCMVVIRLRLQMK